MESSEPWLSHQSESSVFFLFLCFGSDQKIDWDWDGVLSFFLSFSEYGDRNRKQERKNEGVSRHHVSELASKPIPT
jgi:hypothetical protein